MIITEKAPVNSLKVDAQTNAKRLFLSISPWQSLSFVFEENTNSAPAMNPLAQPACRTIYLKRNTN